MTDLTFAALIPAAGESSRMGEFKPLVEIGGQTLIERAINLFQEAGVHEIVIVAGHRGEELIPALGGTSCRVTINSDYQQGMLTSIKAGARELPGRCDAFFVLPVDIPLVRPLTLRRLMEQSRDSSGLVFHPVFQSRRGHPPLVKSSLLGDLLAFTGAGGLKGFLEKYTNRSADVPVADAWIRRDVDTEEDLAALRMDFEGYAIPTPEECGVILDHYLEVPQAVQAHSRAVAHIARCLGASLNAAGGNLDLRLVEAAGLLHDIFKGHEDHAGRGAAWLEGNGFPEIAAIVAEHTDILWERGDQVDERALVYLADKILAGERILTLADRREAALKKYGQEEAARRNIAARFDTAAKIQTTVEKITGLSLIKILESSGK